MILRSSYRNNYIFGLSNPSFKSFSDSNKNTIVYVKDLGLGTNSVDFNQTVQALSRQSALPSQSFRGSNFIRLKHTLKFNTFFTPGSIKALRLYNLVGFSKYNNSFSLGSRRFHNKILINQSYIILSWLGYISSSQASRKEVSRVAEYSSNYKKLRAPSFFVHPKRNYKITTIKSPMAHKTFSQEQFIVRYYSMSLSFFTTTHYNKFTANAKTNSTSYYILWLLGAMPSISTNMLFLTKYTIFCRALPDQLYFSYFKTLKI